MSVSEASTLQNNQGCEHSKPVVKQPSCLQNLAQNCALHSEFTNKYEITYQKKKKITN